MPRLCVVKSKKIKEILCNNPHEYCSVIEPIFEVHKVNRHELTELPCRTTHKIKTQSSKVLENDNLYTIFLKYTKYDVTVIRNWLKVFMMANRQRRASKYLVSKVLTYENWSDSINDGRKGDVLALYRLCMLFSQHAVVHLHNNLIWSTLASIDTNHLDDLQKCDIHLCYLGRGLFMELIEHDVPLQILDDKPNTQSIVIGELTIKEDLMPKTSQTELVIAKSVKTKRVATQGGASTSGHSTYTSGICSYQSRTKKDSKLTQIMKILVVKMNILDPNKSYQLTQQQLLQLPKSRYRPDDYLGKLSSPRLKAVLTTSSIHGDSDETLRYSSSDETIPYWTFSNDNASTSQSPLNKHNKIDSTTNIKGIKNWKKNN